jgi:hypothetical protein
MDGISWKLDPAILGLAFLAIAPGVAGEGTATATFPKRAMYETAAVGIIGTLVSKSWWPIAAPVLYLGYDFLWNKYSDEAQCADADGEVWR